MLDYAEDKFIDVDGINIRYRYFGTGVETLVFIHGLAASLDYWYKLVPDLAKYYKIVTFDLPGHGHSDKPILDYSTQFYLQFLEKFIKYLQIKNFTLIGHSFGGGIALKFTIMHPESVKKLILLSNTGFSKKIILFFRLLTIPGLRNILTKVSLNKVKKFLLLGAYDESVITKDLIDRMHQIVLQPGFHHMLFSTLKYTITFFGVKRTVYEEIIDKLPSVMVPILLIWGSEDKILPLQWQQQALKRCYATDRVIVLLQCGHLIHIERFTEVKNLIEEFMLSNSLENKV